MRFRIGQKWVSKDRSLRGEVIEISDDGRSGVVVITDDKGNRLDTFLGAAAEFLGPGQWEPAA